MEKFENNGASNGKIIRYFDSYADGSLPEPSTFPIVPQDNRSWVFGQLKKELVYDKNGVLLKQTRNEYGISQDSYYNTPGRLDNFTSISLAPYKYQCRNPYSGCYPGMQYVQIWEAIKGPVYFKSQRFSPFTGRKDLTKTRVIEYAGNDSLVNEISYTRDDAFNVINTQTKNSRDQVVEEIVHFPSEYSTNLVATNMLSADNNMYAVPIAVEKWKTIGGTKYLTGGIVNQYQQSGTAIRKSTIESLETTSPVPESSVPAIGSSLNRAPALIKPKIEFQQYTSKGFIAQQAKVGDAPQSIIWDYNQQYPIAQVANASVDRTAYTSFEADGLGGWQLSVGSVIFETSNAPTGKKVLSGGVSKVVPAGNYVVGVWSYANTWVNGQAVTQPLKIIGPWRYFEVKLTNVTNITVSGDSIDEVRLCSEGAQMTTYTYDPLFGLTSTCDANNRIIYYEYDGFGRLKHVRDENKNILKRYDYQFQKNTNQ
ncbi:hypothetical protein [Paraflavitalea pollutisoli]|uniref:hypothetical protein n=1 Tax=Paraflavitalea pollutisoli TaxID=3034143 RepID=UPI0023EC4D23|nr:hypothetical protein [Paraflavitalea sp. H1-2-19X]